MIAAAPQVTVPGANYHHVPAVFINDGAAASVGAYFLSRSPGFSAILAAPEQPRAPPKGQDCSISGHHNIRDSRGFIEILHTKYRRGILVIILLIGRHVCYLLFFFSGFFVTFLRSVCR